MSENLCRHLEQYGELYQAAAGAYHECLQAMDEVLSGARGPAQVRRMEDLLNSWEKSTRNLRATFASLVDKGKVLLPREGQNDQPVCGHCGCEIPRLEFAEFTFQEDGSVLFRGQLLCRQEPVPA